MTREKRKQLRFRIQKKSMHVSLHINDKLRFAAVPLPSPLSSSKMAEEEMRKTRIASVKLRQKSIEIQCDSDDNEPIGCLLKFKKLHSTKRLTSGFGSTEARVRDLKMEVAYSRETDDTLASF